MSTGRDRHNSMTALKAVVECDCLSKSDELVPEDGKDEVYDEVMSEINELEEELKAELKSIRKKTGFVHKPHICRIV